MQFDIETCMCKKIITSGNILTNETRKDRDGILVFALSLSFTCRFYKITIKITDKTLLQFCKPANVL